MVAGAVLSGAVGLAVAFGGYRLYGFLHGIKVYRDKTKSENLAAPPGLVRLLDASKGGELKFFRINDEVMGGKSISELSIGNGGSSLIFAGTINTNGGGFASCRTLGDEAPLGLSNGTTSTLLVDATGDGFLHKLTLHTADSWQMGTPSWSADFLTERDVRATHRLPLAEFIASKQGRPVRGATLDGSAVTGLGFGLSLYTADGKPNPHFGDGPFHLEVHSVKEVDGGNSGE